MPAELRISHPKLVGVIRRTLDDVGVPPAISEIEAEIAAEADLLGVPSHGIKMLPGLLQAIQQGRVNPKPKLKIFERRVAACVLDGDHGPGRYVSTEAMRNAVERAKIAGVGACVATRLTHWGRAHAYVYRAAREGAIGICTTNAIPNVVAWGSSKPLLANNPLAIGVPRGAGEEPIILDMAMSQAAVGKIRTFLREGRTAPPNWGQDASGQPTGDPAVILSGGRVLPFGDHKGVGLAVMMELLTGALADGLLSFEIARSNAAGQDPDSSKLFLALDVTAFVEPERFAQRVRDFINWLHHTEPGLEIMLPGERGWRARQQYLAEGIPIHPEIVRELKQAGISLE
jgi:LDH2 family malate/lactate/ureidoglycolate dehydrogenase